jgi:DNA-binding transcriptional ArsR family regulator
MADRFKRQARIIKAMAHPTRLAIIDLLSRGERCVCDIQRTVGSDMSTISKHLALLRSAGLVSDRKEGLRVIYRLRVPCILRFMDCIEAVNQADAAELAAAER